MASAWWEEQWQPELHDRPVTLTCDECGQDFTVHPDDMDEDDDVRRCETCTVTARLAFLLMPPKTVA